MDKCKWEGGYYVPCGEHQDIAKLFNLKLGVSISGELKTLGVDYCPLCGEDIREPESEVIIKKDGGTWVARYDGVDYLRVGGTVFIQLNDDDIKHIKNNPALLKVHDSWKPISKIEITDEIAKLRPMVVDSGADTNYTRMLYGVSGKCCIFKYSRIIPCDDGMELITVCRLATVDDLED